MEPANRVLRRDITLRPGPFRPSTRRTHERQPQSVWILEGQHALAKPLLDRFMRNALLNEPVHPEAERLRRHPEGSLEGLADPHSPGCHVLPWEKGEDRAWPAGLVAVVEVVGAGIVEVHGPLHEAQTEHLRVEIEVAAR
jgi:hypothetical protein